MIVTVKIECETITELKAHLSKLQHQINQEVLRLGLLPDTESFDSTVYLDDDNCYGSHEVTFKEEE